MKINSENKLVALASIAAELHSVKNIAWGVSIAAKNAKIMSVQAGERGRGFQPITQFIDEISQQVMTGIDDITEAALRLSKMAVYEQRCVEAYQRFNQVQTKNSSAKNLKSLMPAIGRVKQTMLTSTVDFKKGMSDLTQLLESMDQCMLSARSIASVSRIVISDAGEYRDNLNVVASDLDESVIHIKAKLLSSYEHLNSVFTANKANNKIKV